MDNFSIEGPRIVFKIPVGDYTLRITETLVNSWIVMILLAAAVIWLGSNLKKIPTTKKQAVAEMAVKFMHGLTDDNLGEGCRSYAPYLAAIFLYTLIGALISLFGFRGVPSDINTTSTMAGMTLCMIMYGNFRYKGAKQYAKGLATPIFLSPLNVMGEFTPVLAMAMRLFGNMSGGAIITALLYGALTAASVGLYHLLGLAGDVFYFNALQVGIPAVLSMYFDLFSGVIQSYVFIMLTMAYVRNARSVD